MNLDKVSVAKTLFKSSTWVQIRADYLLQRDLGEKLTKVKLTNRDFLAKKEAELSRAKSAHTGTHKSQPAASSRPSKFEFSCEDFEQRQQHFLDSKNRSNLEKEKVLRTKPSVAIELNPDLFELYCAE